MTGMVRRTAEGNAVPGGIRLMAVLAFNVSIGVQSGGDPA